jgi:hypothetical protein
MSRYGWILAFGSSNRRLTGLGDKHNQAAIRDSLARRPITAVAEAGEAEPQEAHGLTFVIFTPGSAPFVNATPAASRAAKYECFVSQISTPFLGYWQKWL